MRHHFDTDIGRVRQLNEDRVIVHTDQAGNLLAIVADGMGGHHAGDVASETTVQTMIQYFRINPPDAQVHVRVEQLRAAIQHANQVVYNMAQANPDMNGMGTTIVAALVDDHDVIVGHVGDSRLYLYQDGVFSQQTEDHTYVQTLLKSGQISEEEALHHPRRNVLIRAVGTDPSVEIDVKYFEWRQGAKLVICSDGLSHRISDHEIREVLIQENSPDFAVKQLIERALHAGGEDNISVIVIENDQPNTMKEGGTNQW